MASFLYITEYAKNGPIDMASGIASEPLITTQKTSDFSGGAQSSSAFSANTQMVRLHTDAVCSVKFGTAPTAATTDRRMSANQTEYFYVPLNGAYKVSVIANT